MCKAGLYSRRVVIDKAGDYLLVYGIIQFSSIVVTLVHEPRLYCSGVALKRLSKQLC